MHVHTRQFANMVKRLAWGRKEEKDKNQIISPLDLTRAVQAVQWQQPQKADSLSFWSVCVSVCLCVCVSVCLCVCVSVCLCAAKLVSMLIWNRAFWPPLDAVIESQGSEAGICEDRHKIH